MRAGLIAFCFVTIAVAPPAFAQAPSTPSPKLLGTAAQIKALTDANTPGTIVQLAPYRSQLELRANGSVGNAAIHPRSHEHFYIIEGTVDVRVGGTLIDPKPSPTNPAVVVGTRIEGGAVTRLSKGDVYIVPANTPHQLTPVGGNVSDMSTLLPAGAPPP